MRIIVSQIPLFKKKSKTIQFLEADKKIMVLKAPLKAKLSVVFTGKNGTRISYPVNEAVNSWVEINEYESFYIYRKRIGLKCEVEISVS